MCLSSGLVLGSHTHARFTLLRMAVGERLLGARAPRPARHHGLSPPVRACVDASIRRCRLTHMDPHHHLPPFPLIPTPPSLPYPQPTDPSGRGTRRCARTWGSSRRSSRRARPSRRSSPRYVRLYLPLYDTHLCVHMHEFHNNQGTPINHPNPSPPPKPLHPPFRWRRPSSRCGSRACPRTWTRTGAGPAPRASRRWTATSTSARRWPTTATAPRRPRRRCACSSGRLEGWMLGGWGGGLSMYIHTPQSDPSKPPHQSNKQTKPAQGGARGEAAARAAEAAGGLRQVARRQPPRGGAPPQGGGPRRGLDLPPVRRRCVVALWMGFGIVGVWSCTQPVSRTHPDTSRRAVAVVAVFGGYGDPHPGQGGGEGRGRRGGQEAHHRGQGLPCTLPTHLTPQPFCLLLAVDSTVAHHQTTTVTNPNRSWTRSWRSS